MADSSRPAAEPARPAVNETRARQGRVGTGLIWVLVLGTLLAAIGLLVAWTWKAPSLANANVNNGPANVNSASAPPDPANAFHAPEPAAIVPQPGTDHTAPQPHQ